MKIAEYVVWILHCKHCKFGEKITRIQLQRYRIFPRGYFFDAPCIYDIRMLESLMISWNIITYFRLSNLTDYSLINTFE